MAQEPQASDTEERTWRDPRTWATWQKVLGTVILLFVLIGIFADPEEEAGRSDEGEPAAEKEVAEEPAPEPEEQTTEPEDGEPAEEAGGDDDTALPEECEPADDYMVAAVEDGLTAEGDASLERAWKVRSDDTFDSGKTRWFIAGAIVAPGLEDMSAIGLWTIGGESETDIGPLLSANHQADEFSVYPFRGEYDDPAADQAEECVELDS